MEGFLKIIKKRNVNIYTESLIDLLQSYKGNRHYSYIKNNNEIISIYYTNEFQNYPYDCEKNELFAPVGNFTINREKVKNIISSSNWEEISKLQGSFAIAYSDFFKNKVTIITHIARVENVFIFEDENKIIVGTDPLLVSMQASQYFKPEFNPENYYSFLQNGYYVDNLTPYKGVVSLPPNKIVEICNGTIKYRDVDDSLVNFLNCDISKIDFDEITNIFINGFKTNININQTNRLALTGGKDSRLIFAAMKHLNMDFSVFTNGFDENPDIIISKEIANKYGYNHETVSPKISNNNTIKVSPYKRMLNTMIGSSGLIYGYDGITVSSKGFQGDRTYDGVAAGLVKGGYSAFNKIESKSKIINTFTSNDNIFKNSGRGQYTKTFDDLIGENMTLEQYNMLSFLNFRTGRWTANAKLGKNYSKRQHSPFIDNLFLKKLLQLNYRDNSNERILYEIMKRLDSELVDIPFAKDRWKFEKFHPEKVTDYSNWIDRQELYPKTILGNYNWRKIDNNDKELVNNFKEIILSNKNSDVFNVVDYATVEEIFKKDITSKDNKLLWSIASQIIFTEHHKNSKIKLKKKQIELSIPETTITKTENSPSLIDYSNKFTSINNSLKIIESNKVIIQNTLNNRYLNSHEGKFDQIPNSKNINDTGIVSLAANIEAEENSRISILFVLYDDKERVKNMRFDPVYSSESQTFFWTEQVKLPKHIKKVRLLINFRDKNVGKSYKINYVNLKV